MLSVESILKEHGLKVTSTRVEVLQTYRDSDCALSHADVEGQLGEEHDRVTLYRTLHAFEDKGLIHKVIEDDGIIKYSLCSRTCDHEQHFDEHAHFSCQLCGKTYCLEAIEVQPPKLPGGYQTDTWYLLIKGVCNKCSAA